tara:strand:- start:11737 stop:12012 length:276 start_codon:yes stop_codon:yes gene_type:complete
VVIGKSESNVGNTVIVLSSVSTTVVVGLAILVLENMEKLTVSMSLQEANCVDGVFDAPVGDRTTVSGMVKKMLPCEGDEAGDKDDGRACRL